MQDAWDHLRGLLHRVQTTSGWASYQNEDVYAPYLRILQNPAHPASLGVRPVAPDGEVLHLGDWLLGFLWEGPEAHTFELQRTLRPQTDGPEIQTLTLAPNTWSPVLHGSTPIPLVGYISYVYKMVPYMPSPSARLWALYAQLPTPARLESVQNAWWDAESHTCWQRDNTVVGMNVADADARPLPILKTNA